MNKLLMLVSLACFSESVLSEPVKGFDGFPWGSSRNQIIEVRGIPDYISEGDGSMTYSNPTTTVAGLQLASVNFDFSAGCSGLRESITSPCRLSDGMYNFENKSLEAFNQITQLVGERYGDYTEAASTREELSDYTNNIVASINEYTERTFSQDDGSSVTVRWAVRGTAYASPYTGENLEAGPMVLVVEYRSPEKNQTLEQSTQADRSF